MRFALSDHDYKWMYRSHEENMTNATCFTVYFKVTPNGPRCTLTLWLGYAHLVIEVTHQSRIRNVAFQIVSNGYPEIIWSSNEHESVTDSTGDITI